MQETFLHKNIPDLCSLFRKDQVSMLPVTPVNDQTLKEDTVYAFLSIELCLMGKSLRRSKLFWFLLEVLAFSWNTKKPESEVEPAGSC